MAHAWLAANDPGLLLKSLFVQPAQGRVRGAARVAAAARRRRQQAAREAEDEEVQVLCLAGLYNQSQRALCPQLTVAKSSQLCL